MTVWNWRNSILRNLLTLPLIEKMKKWLSFCPGLLQRLYDLGYDSNRRSFTPLEVRVIVDALGKP